MNHSKLEVLNLKDLLALKRPARQMILDPILPEQGLVMIHAPRGIGKTYVSLTLAYAVATGTEMFQGRWKSTAPNKVLFVDGEMPFSVMQERLAHIVRNSNKDPIPENLCVVTPDLQPHGIPDLSTRNGQKALEAHLNGVKLLILDNYSALCRSGRENEAESWVPFQEWFLSLRRQNIAVLLIHHSNKQGSQRGTSRKEDLLDTVITLRRPLDYNPRQGARFEVHYEKARGFFGDAAEPFEAWLKEEEEDQLRWQVNGIDNCSTQLHSLQKEGISQREIGRLMGLSVATIHRRLKGLEND